MIKNEIEIVHDGQKFVVELYDNEISFYKIGYETCEFSSDYMNEKRVYTIGHGADINNPVALYRKLSKAVKGLVYGSKLNYLTFNFLDDHMEKIYDRFAATLVGYTYQKAENYYYLYKG
jgi:hypothetical protein